MGYNVFISYRRDGASELAQLLYSRLQADGYAPFFDVESMRSGKFNKQLFDRIEECQDMLLLLPPHALDPRDTEEDWVLLEIAHALKHRKNIVPVFMRNFQWPDQLPEEIAELRHCHGITADMEYFDAVYARIKSLLKSEPASKGAIDTVTNARLRVVEIMLENGEFAKAGEQYQQILNIDPKLAAAYLGLVMVQYQLRNKEALREYYRKNIIYDNLYLKLAWEYADEETLEFLVSLVPPVCAADGEVATGNCELCGAPVCDTCGVRIQGDGLEPVPWVDGKLLCPHCLERMRKHTDIMRKENIAKIVFCGVLWGILIGLCFWIAHRGQWNPYAVIGIVTGLAWSLITAVNSPEKSDQPDAAEGDVSLFALGLRIAACLFLGPVVALIYIGKRIFYMIKMGKLRKQAMQADTASGLIGAYYGMVSVTRKLNRTEPGWE